MPISTPLIKPHFFACSHICILCFQDCIEYKKSRKNLVRHILSNGPHLVSPQEAPKVTKTQNEATVEPYFWSLVDCHPVCIIIKPQEYKERGNQILCNIMTLNYLIIEKSGKCNHNRQHRGLESNDCHTGARVSLTSKKQFKI